MIREICTLLIKLTLIVMFFGGNVFAEVNSPKKIFAKYNFSNLDPVNHTILYSKIDVDIWERCSCDCPHLISGNLKHEETIDQFNCRNSNQVVNGPYTIKGTKQQDGTILISKTDDDCTVDSVINAVGETAPLPCDSNCAEPATSDSVSNNVGCASTGSTLWMIPIILL